MVMSIILAAVGLLAGGALGYFGVNAAMKAKVARKLKEAEDQGENIKRNKLLEAKEKFLNMKAEFEKEVAERNSKIQQSENRAQQIENRAQQKEQQVNQKQKELDRKNNEVEAIRENLEKQLTLVDAKQTELDKLNFEATEKLSAQVEEIMRALAHRPFDPDSHAYRDFKSKLLLKIERLTEKYPFFDFSNELKQCRTQ